MNRQILLILLISLLISSSVDIFPEPHALKYQDKEFNELANFLLDHKDIYEMDDFTRHHKRLNGISIKLSDKEGNQDAHFLNVKIL